MTDPKKYIPPQEIGSTWSTPLDRPIWGLGGIGSLVMVGQYHLTSIPHALATLTLGLIKSVKNPLVGNPIFGQIYAELTVGCGAAAYLIQMDWAHGSSITLPVGNVTVNARQAAIIDYKIQLSASLVIGTRGSRLPATYTIYTGPIPAGGPGVFFPVPSRARWVMVPRVTIGAPSDLGVRVFRSAAAGGVNIIAAYSHLDPLDSLLWQTGVLMPGPAESIQLTSGVGIGTDNQTIVFGLDG